MTNRQDTWGSPCENWLAELTKPGQDRFGEVEDTRRGGMCLTNHSALLLEAIQKAD